MAATTKTSTWDFNADIGFLTRASKAPTMRDAVARLAERARAESWMHEEFLVACLQREAGPGTCSAKVRAPQLLCHREPSDSKPNQYQPAADRRIMQAALISTVHALGSRNARRARRVLGGGMATIDDAMPSAFDLLHADTTEVRQQ
jgi:hypothetical protein